jgi:hypothetical protein
MNPLLVSFIADLIHRERLSFNTDVTVCKINNYVSLLALVEIDIFTNSETPVIIGDLRICKLHIHPLNAEAIEKFLSISGHANDEKSLISKALHPIARPDGPS